MTFKDLNLIEPIQKALAEEGYETPTPIQSQAIPHALKGRDVLGCAQTGTGKTAAFAVPILQNLHALLPENNRHRKIKTLILTPTRELAIQIGDSFKAYSRHLHVRGTVIFGGVSQKPQETILKKGIDILVATPGRLLDLMGQGIISLADVEIFVLDEADRMLDMGFIHDVRKVIRELPPRRQTLFFSATMPKEIARLASDILTDPVKVAVTPVSSTAEKVEQVVYFVEKKKKKKLLVELLKDPAIVSALVFTRTKHGANRVARDLSRAGVEAMAIHGNKSQTARQKALGSFKEGKIRVLVATDIAARGIDVEELSHVINFDLPNIPETYVHRIGRTGRAGLSGIALSFCDVEEIAYLHDIQKLIGKKVPMNVDHPYHYDPHNPPPLPPKQERPPRRGGNRPGHQQRPGRNQNPRSENPRKQTNTNRPDRSKNTRKPPAEERRNNRRYSGQQRPQKQRNKQNPVPASNGKNDGEDKQWSSIFLKPKSGSKGFVIKSDRYDKPKKKKRKRPPRQGRGKKC
ncbi:MAG TPA: DEAD/DEAH box helicase [Bacteroidetes bacterium]|nr:DEAD/DEAH box helicase [Bacteroidota bacterium]